MKSNFSPSKILILLGAACCAWIGILSFAILGFAGFGWSLGWLVPVVLGFSFIVWFAILVGDFRSAAEPQAVTGTEPAEEFVFITSPLPFAALRGRSGGSGWRGGRATGFRRAAATAPRRRSLSHGVARGDFDS